MSGISGDLKAVYDVLYYVAFNFAKAVMAFLQRDSFLYWPFIVSTLAIMVVVAYCAARSEGRTWRRQFGDYFSAGVWWHPSARADYRLYFANALLLPLIFGWLLFSDAHVAGFMDSILGRHAAPAASAGIAGKAADCLAALHASRSMAESLSSMCCQRQRSPLRQPSLELLKNWHAGSTCSHHCSRS